MNIKKILIISLYVTLTSALSFKVAQTVFNGSILIGRGASVSSLTAQRKQLKETRQKLTKQIDQARTLAQISQSEELESFTAIEDPIQLVVSQTVASK